MSDKMIGMYVHQHWPYNYPYAARTWQVDDWRGYAGCLRKIGYNAMLIWPLLEMMPDPLPPSDKRYLENMSRVIAMLKHELDMKVFIALCPNVWAVSEVAARSSICDRNFFYSDIRINPGDRNALDTMIRWREKLLEPLKLVDGVTIIDSDPGGYAGSTNQEYVNLLLEHRRMLDRIRPGIELVYWMHAGWQAYSRFYETGSFEFGLEDEFIDTLQRLSQADPKPWAIANGFAFAEKLGLGDRVYGYNYGAIEGEPSFPMTNFGGDLAYNAGAMAMPRGVLGNAQTHCAQLPNTFAFVRGALGKPVSNDDYLEFAEGLAPGHGAKIVRGWQTLTGTDAKPARAAREELNNIPCGALKEGDLGGLLFGSPARFVNDLCMMLDMCGSCIDLCNALNNGAGHRAALREFVTAADMWQAKHGYRNRWNWPDLFEALKKLNSPGVNHAITMPLDQAIGTSFAKVKEAYYMEENHTLQVLQSLKRALIGKERLGPQRGWL
ncbi:MAG: hypothetical protein WCK47_11965 [bacterium]